MKGFQPFRNIKPRNRNAFLLYFLEAKFQLSFNENKTDCVGTSFWLKSLSMNNSNNKAIVWYLGDFVSSDQDYSVEIIKKER